MDRLYAVLAQFATTWGLLYFCLIFGVVIAYTLWPSNAATFRRAARMPLQEKETEDDRPIV
jgi:cytochrome c oxidase cbb3-type subunit IV